MLAVPVFLRNALMFGVCLAFFDGVGGTASNPNLAPSMLYSVQDPRRFLAAPYRAARWDTRLLVREEWCSGGARVSSGAGVATAGRGAGPPTLQELARRACVEHLPGTLGAIQAAKQAVSRGTHLVNPVNTPGVRLRSISIDMSTNFPRRDPGRVRFRADLSPSLGPTTATRKTSSVRVSDWGLLPSGRGGQPDLAVTHQEPHGAGRFVVSQLAFKSQEVEQLWYLAFLLMSAQPECRRAGFAFAAALGMGIANENLTKTDASDPAERLMRNRYSRDGEVPVDDLTAAPSMTTTIPVLVFL